MLNLKQILELKLIYLILIYIILFILENFYKLYTSSFTNHWNVVTSRMEQKQLF